MAWLSAASGGGLVTPGVPWLPGASPRSLPLSAPGVLPVYMSVSRFPFYKDISPMRL